MLIISHEGVEVIFLPERTRSLEMLIDLPCGESLPRVDDSSQRMPFDGLEENMHMIRHHTPGEKPVALPVKMKKSVLNDLRTLRLTQNT